MGFLERFLARRYLFSREKKALVSAITLVAVSGVAVGVASLIIVIGVMDGAERDLFGKIIEVYPHARVTGPYGREVAKPDPILRVLASRPEVVSAEPVVSKDALMTASLGARAELVAARIMSVRDLASHARLRLAGPAAEAGGALRDFEIVLGKPLAEKLKIEPGQTLRAILGATARSANRQGAGGREFRVAGTFESGYHAFDVLTAFVSPSTAEKVFGLAGAVDSIEIKLRDPFAAEDVGAALQLELGPTAQVATWRDENGAFFDSLVIQKWGLFLILMLIVLVAGFNIIGTLILMVIDKTREVGILKACGASRGMIRMTFLSAGLLIGALGTALGVALGLVGCLLLKYAIRLEMPPSVYNFDRLPVLVKPATVAVIVASSMIVSALSALFPAAQAARLNPVEALRHD